MNDGTCCTCSKPATYSVACVLSTVGAKPRIQQCSPAIRLCAICIRELCESPGASAIYLRKALKQAYTRANRQAAAVADLENIERTWG